MKVKKVPTGIDKLDEMICGGLIQGRNYLVCGETGAGKTIFGLQFLMKGLELGEPGVYVTVDQRPSELIEDAISFNFPIEKEIEERKMMLLDFSSHFDQLRETSKGIDVRRVVGDLHKYIREIDAKRLVIDTIGSFIPQDGKSWETRSYARSLFYSLNSLGSTNILMSTIPKSSFLLSTSGFEELYAAGIIQLAIQERDGLPNKRTISVRKMRSTPHPLESYYFEFKRDKGIVIQDKVWKNKP
jgi:KaiC/GvpD/RAD55 family RecA-like ATPase